MSETHEPIDTTCLHNEKWRTKVPHPGASTMSAGDKPRALTHESALGYDVFRWPEFQALAKRLMVDLESCVTEVQINVPCEGCVRVAVTSNGQDITKPKE